MKYIIGVDPTSNKKSKGAIAIIDLTPEGQQIVHQYILSKKSWMDKLKFKLTAWWLYTMYYKNIIREDNLTECPNCGNPPSTKTYPYCSEMCWRDGQ